MKSKNYDRIREAYLRGSYTDTILAFCVKKKLITQAEYEELLNEKGNNFR